MSPGSVDELDPAAAALRSVNTVVPIGDGRLKGYSTDGAGFVASLAAQDVEVDGQACLRARRAVARRGRSSTRWPEPVRRPSPSSTGHANERNGCGARWLTASAWSGEPDDIADCDIVVNATSIGMGSDELPCDPQLLHDGQVVADIVYHPRSTALLAAARDRGAGTVEGLGMLVHQAVVQQQLWTGIAPDSAVMWAAAERELASRGQ